MYHFVCPAKYRRVVFSEAVDKSLKEVCLEISKRYEIEFIEIGTDKDHVHFLIQSVPMMSPTQMRSIMGELRSRFTFEDGAEIAIEIDPRTLTREIAEALGECGFNRASLGCLLYTSPSPRDS